VKFIGSTDLFSSDVGYADDLVSRRIQADLFKVNPTVL